MSTIEPLPVAAPPEFGEEATWAQIAPECLPDVDKLIIEDGKPMDNVFVEKQLRLLTEPLYSSWPGPEEGRTFKVLANVGLFYALKEPALAPDVMLSLDVPVNVDLSRKENRSYMIWEVGKPPNVVIEIVSDRRGGELGHKMLRYERLGVPYYIIFDPAERLESGVLQAFALQLGAYHAIEPKLLPTVGLGLLLWQGFFEGQEGMWLRWCAAQGQVIPTGQERAEQERQRADQERQRAERLEAQLRELGIEPNP